MVESQRHTFTVHDAMVESQRHTFYSPYQRLIKWNPMMQWLNLRDTHLQSIPEVDKMQSHDALRPTNCQI